MPAKLSGDTLTAGECAAQGEEDATVTAAWIPDSIETLHTLGQFEAFLRGPQTPRARCVSPILCLLQGLSHLMSTGSFLVMWA